MYPTSKGGRRYLSKEGTAFKAMVYQETIKTVRNSDFSFNPDNQYISSEIYFYTPKLLTKQRRINKTKPDTDNCLKALNDSIFEALGLDDCYNLDVSASVHYSEEPMIVVILRVHSLTSKVDTTDIWPET